MKAIQKRLRHLASKEQKELKEEGLYRKDNYSAEEDSAFRRIGFAALLIYHIERWRQIEDGATFSLTKDIPKLMSENTSQKLKNNFWATLKNHPKPIEVIIGDHPKFPSDWNNIAAKLPYLELQKIDKAGYHIWIDQPKKFESSMGEALNRATN